MTSLDLGKSRGRPRAGGFTELGGRGRSNPVVRREQRSLEGHSLVSGGVGVGGRATEKGSAQGEQSTQANAAEGVRYSVCLQGGGQKRTKT